MERVPLLKRELAKIMKKYKGHIIATSACAGGELSTLALEKYNLDINGEDSSHVAQKMLDFVLFCQDIFGKEDFYIECAPSSSHDQIAINKILYNFSKVIKIKMVPATDSHYLTAKDRPIHKAYLNSKNGEREIDSFYEFTYLMDSDEITSLLKLSFPEDEINKMLDNTEEINNKIEYYNLFQKQKIMEVEVKDYPKKDGLKDYDTLHSLLASDNIQERYWINQCLEGLQSREKYNDTYLTRLEEEAKTKKIIGEKLETCMFAYPNTLQHYIDLFWECGSIVGAGRGSSCSGLNHYLLGITQLDPIRWGLPWFRYMNAERVEIGDIDLDLCPSKRPLIIQKIKEERSKDFYQDVPQWAKDNLGITLIATFGTEQTKSAILAAGRGYRGPKDEKEIENSPIEKEEWDRIKKDGLDVEEAQYLSSLIPSERGFLFPIQDVVYGNPEKGRKPIKTFINEVNKYPGLLDIIMSIAGLVNKRSSHASGVVFFEKNPFEHCAFMKTPKGEIITQYDLHDTEFEGNTKYDYLVTEVSDKIVKTIDLLQEDNVIDPKLTLREVYNKYLHPEIFPIDDKRIWKALEEGSVVNVFQFDSQVGIQAAKKIKPQNIYELSDANGLMRLMGEPNEERPFDKYVRFKNNIKLWYKEMDDFGLTKEEQKTLEPYFKQSYGVPPSQEQLMLMVMDPKICGFTLAESNSARKIVGKKQMEKIPELHQKILDQATRKRLGEYVWKYGVGPQMGYSFSMIHAMAYSFIGAQTLYLATNWNPIYWDTACLIVNSGALSEDGLEENFEEEETTNKKKKTVSADYGKTAKAISDIQQAGIQVSLPNINKSKFGFAPDVENNRILFGLKGMLNVGDELVNEIIANRPYNNPKDFLLKVKPKKSSMISLIKGGAFDEMMDRKLLMGWYIWETCDKKSRLTLQNMASLIKYNLLPTETENQIMARRVYEFNRYLKAICKFNATDYKLDERAVAFLTELDQEFLIKTANNSFLLGIKAWDKVYQEWMNVFRKWITINKDKILDDLNTVIFKEDWDKYAYKNNLSAWEMEVLCFYYHEHELTHLNNARYGFVDFYKLPEEPIIDKTFKKGGHEIKIYKLFKICGTCIAKNKAKGTFTLMTTSGPVEVRDSREHFALYDKRISEIQPDGTKKIMEKSWFDRGNMVAILGVRSGDNFIMKKYASSNAHTIYRIVSIDKDGLLELTNDRYKGGIAEDEEI